MAALVRRIADVDPVPWRNGLGRTWELVGEDLAQTLTRSRWRLSVAQLTAPAPFSLFPGRARTLVPWGGDIVLSIDGRLHSVRAGEAVRFPGAARTQLTQLEHPCHALNLMASDAGTTLAAAHAGAVLPADAVVLVGEPAGELARFDVLLVPAGEAIPTEGVIVRLPDDHGTTSPPRGPS